MIAILIVPSPHKLKKSALRELIKRELPFALYVHAH